MTQQEFISRTGIQPTQDEFNYIHELYLNTDMDKDEFCKEYKKHKDCKIIKQLHVRVRNHQSQEVILKQKSKEIAEILIGKASAYHDTDMYNEAVKLIGKKNVVQYKIRFCLPLWEEDKEYIERNLI